MGYDVYATDIAEPQLVVAENNARDAGLAVSFAMSDGVSSPFGDKQFDVIVIWTQVLGNIPSQEDTRLRQDFHTPNTERYSWRGAP